MFNVSLIHTVYGHSPIPVLSGFTFLKASEEIVPVCEFLVPVLWWKLRDSLKLGSTSFLFFFWTIVFAFLTAGLLSSVLCCSRMTYES